MMVAVDIAPPAHMVTSAVRPATVAHLLACSVGAAALSALTTAALRRRAKTLTTAR